MAESLAIQDCPGPGMYELDLQALASSRLPGTRKAYQDYLGAGEVVLIDGRCFELGSKNNVVAG